MVGGRDGVFGDAVFVDPTRPKIGPTGGGGSVRR